MNKSIMRRIIVLTTILVSIILCGCKKEEMVSPDNEMCTIGVSFCGDIGVQYSPLTKGSTETVWYGINVSKGTSNCSLGIYDDVSKIKLVLPKGSQYKITCTAVTGVETEFYRYGKWSNSGYLYYLSYPFIVGYLGSQDANYINKQVSSFPYYANRDDALNNRSAKKTSLTAWPYIAEDTNSNWYRFYGTYEMTPVEDGDISIDMKHAGFGLKYSVQGITDGSVKVTIKGKSGTILFENTSISADYTSEQKVFALTDLTKENESASASVIWTRGNGIVENLGTANFIVKRNQKNNVTITLGATEYSPSVSITTENSEYIGNDNSSIVLQ